MQIMSQAILSNLGGISKVGDNSKSFKANKENIII